MKIVRKTTQKLLLVLTGMMLLCCMACSSNEEVLFVDSSTSTESDSNILTEEKNSADGNGAVSDTVGRNAGGIDISEDATTPDMDDNTDDATSSNTDDSTNDGFSRNADDKEPIVVHVCGAVKLPGVYELDSDARVIDAVTAAGGMLADADSDYVNLAATVSDGDKVRIPTKDEVKSLPVDGNGAEGLEIITSNSQLSASEAGTKKTPDKVNINTADAEELCTLPGIGQTRAESILAYRKENGEFSVIEDIMKVSGIKENSFQKIKDRITVK